MVPNGGHPWNVRPVHQPRDGTPCSSLLRPDEYRSFPSPS
jgi:hypothetical protein